MEHPSSEWRCRRIAAVAGVTSLFAAMSAAIASAGPPAWHVDRTAAGEIRVEARGAPVPDILRAIGSKANFDVVIDDSIPRPPVDVVLAPTSVEEALQHVLNDRNYALLYDDETGAVSCVIVLPPSAPKSPSQRQAPTPVRRR